MSAQTCCGGGYGPGGVFILSKPGGAKLHKLHGGDVFEFVFVAFLPSNTLCA
jgi:hypothetical protein